MQSSARCSRSACLSFLRNLALPKLAGALKFLAIDVNAGTFVIIYVALRDCGPDHRPVRLGARECVVTLRCRKRERDSIAHGRSTVITKQRAAMAEREHRRNKRILRLLCFVVAIAVAFVAGFALRSQDQFLVSLGFSIPGVQKAGTQSTDVKKSPYDSISARLSEVEDVLAKSDLNGYDLDEATKEVFKGFSSACDDKYFEYLDPSRYASFVKDSSDGAYNGVGVLFSDSTVAHSFPMCSRAPLPKRPASQQGDVLVGIDGDTSHDWSVTEAISGLSRNAGETVVVTWMRPSSVGAETGTSYTTALTCSSYKEQKRHLLA